MCVARLNVRKSACMPAWLGGWLAVGPSVCLCPEGTCCRLGCRYVTVLRRDMTRCTCVVYLISA